MNRFRRLLKRLTHPPRKVRFYRNGGVPRELNHLPLAEQMRIMNPHASEQELKEILDELGVTAADRRPRKTLKGDILTLDFSYQSHTDNEEHATNDPGKPQDSPGRRQSIFFPDDYNPDTYGITEDKKALPLYWRARVTQRTAAFRQRLADRERYALAPARLLPVAFTDDTGLATLLAMTNRQQDEAPAQRGDAPLASETTEPAPATYFPDGEKALFRAAMRRLRRNTQTTTEASPLPDIHEAPSTVTSAEMFEIDNRQSPFYPQNNTFIRRSMEKAVAKAEAAGDVFGPDAPAFDPKSQPVHTLEHDATGTIKDFFPSQEPGAERITAADAGITGRMTVDAIVKLAAALTTDAPDAREAYVPNEPFTHKKGYDLAVRIAAAQRRPKTRGEANFFKEYVATMANDESRETTKPSRWQRFVGELGANAKGFFTEAYTSARDRFQRNWNNLKESEFGNYAAMAGIVGITTLLALSPLYYSLSRQTEVAKRGGEARLVVRKQTLLKTPTPAEQKNAPVQAAAQQRVSPLEHVVEDSYRCAVPGVQWLTMHYGTHVFTYQPEDGRIALPGPLLEYAHAHLDEKVVLTAQTGDDELSFTLPLSLLVGQEASDYGEHRFKGGDVAREHRSDAPTSTKEWSPYPVRQDAPSMRPGTGDTNHQGLQPSSPLPAMLDARVAGLALYSQRHRQDSEHGYMTPSEISDHLADIYDVHLGRQDFIAARRALVADGLTNGRSLHNLAKELKFSYSTIQRDVQALRA